MPCIGCAKSVPDEGLRCSWRTTTHPSSRNLSSGGASRRPVGEATLSHKGRGEVRSHWWRDAVAADIDAGGFQGAVFFLHGAEDDDLGARLQLGLLARDEGDDR